MIEDWILTRLEPLKREKLIILRDPQRIVQAGAQAIDGWAEQNEYTVLFCSGNLALREMYEAVRDDDTARILLVDRTREDARIPLFYPDMDALVSKKGQIVLSLQQYLIDTTADTSWPSLVDDRKLSRLIIENLPDSLQAHKYLRDVDKTRFTDRDLYQIVLGSALKINPFRKLSPGQVRQVCIEQHASIESLARILPENIMATLNSAIESAPKPFCWLLERDPERIIMAFTLSAIMRQHDLDYKLLLSNLDPSLHEFREIEPDDLDAAMKDLLRSDPDRVVNDIGEAEKFLSSDKERLALLLRDQIQLDDPNKAFDVLKHEKLSLRIRSLALLSLLIDLIVNLDLKFHSDIVKLLDSQLEDTELLAMRRPTEYWQDIEDAYRRAFTIYRLTQRLLKYEKKLRVANDDNLVFDDFHRLWNEEKLNRLDFYIADLERKLRVGMATFLRPYFWIELESRWETAKTNFAQTVLDIKVVQNLIDTRFQDFYYKNYGALIQQHDAPVVFTHQFLPRMLKAHWDPKSGQKAVILVFDGLRTDAWDEFLRPIFEERFDVIEERPGSAILPTETQLSRKAISAGILPEKFNTNREDYLLKNWLKDNMGLKVNFTVEKEDNQVKSGMSIAYTSKQIDYIVFNFTDKNLHEADDLARFYNSTVRDIIREDVRSVVHNLPEDALVFITSDHGFTANPADTITVPESHVVDKNDVKYRNARATNKLQAPDDQNSIAFDIRTMGIPIESIGKRLHYVIFPRPGYTLKRPRYGHKPDRYTHGGLTLAECMVPMVVMGPRQKVTPLLIIHSLRQVGAVNEGEELTLEILVNSTQLMPPDVAITLSFNRDDMPTRREVFRSSPATYTVRWLPKLQTITTQDRESGSVNMFVTVILSYRQEHEVVRVSKSTEIRIKLDTARLRRRVDSKLDLLMGKVPKSLKT